jgi:hypothetical protein
MKPVPVIRAASILCYIVGIGTLLGFGPSLAYFAVTGTSLWAKLGGNPAYGVFSGVVGFGVVFLVVAALLPVAGYWLGRSERRGGRLGAGLAVVMTALASVLGLPYWIVVVPVILILIAFGWTSLR